MHVRVIGHPGVDAAGLLSVLRHLPSPALTRPWSPSPITDASSKDALKKTLTGINEEYQATDRGDLDLNEIKKKAGSV